MNTEIIAMLDELTDIMKRSGEIFRSKAYETASNKIMIFDKKIINPKVQLKGMKGIGNTIIEKIETFIKTGTLEILERERNNPINMFTKIYGIGPKKADEIVKQGIINIEQLNNNTHLLNDKQKIGLKYFEDINQRIPRKEIDDFNIKLAMIIDELFTENKDTTFEIVGSYRREKPDSGDIDIIITNHSNNKKVFDEILDYLFENKYILKDGFLSRGETKSLTIVDIYPESSKSIKRRVDFLYSSPEEYPFAILYFTGSKIFNTLMRQHALDLGYTLNEHCLSHMKHGIKGEKVKERFKDEESIFQFLNLKYKEPKDRIDISSIEKFNEIKITQTDTDSKIQETVKETIEETVKEIIKEKKNTTLKKKKEDNIQKFKEKGISFLSTLTISELSKIIEKANKVYYNNLSPLLTDNEYDILRDYLLEKDPSNKFALNQHAETNVLNHRNKVLLPYELWSMDKIKPDSKELEKWKNKFTGPYIISHKLDGISALFMYTSETNTKQLFTRGNGKEGNDISNIIPYLIKKNDSIFKILKKLNQNFAIRGEIIIKRKKFEEKYKDKFANPRNFVAGIVNKKIIDPTILSDLDFVPYELIEPKLIPSKQLEFIEKYWKEKPVQYEIIKNIDNKILSDKLIKWRENSEYEIDGIICLNDKIYERPKKNPDYAFAFKMVSNDQMAEAKVLDIIWTPSKDGYLKPRIQIEKIELGGVVIEYTTGFNAKFIVDNKIGLGSIITIIRSGDVIPHVLNVVKNSEFPLLPDVEYKWNESNVDIYIKDKNNAIVKEKNIVGFFKGINIEGIGPGNIKKFINAGFDSIEKILSIKKEQLLNIEGFKEKMATKIFNNINEGIQKANIFNIIAASNLLGRGFGEKKIKQIFEKYPDILDLNKSKTKSELIELLVNIEGIAKITAEKYIDNLQSIKDFLIKTNLLNKLNESNLSNESDHTNNKNLNLENNPLYNKKIVFSGFRDKQLSELLLTYNVKIEENINKDTNYLIVKDIEDISSKIDKAKKLSIPIVDKNKFLYIYNL